MKSKLQSYDVLVLDMYDNLSAALHISPVSLLTYECLPGCRSNLLCGGRVCSGSAGVAAMTIGLSDTASLWRMPEQFFSIPLGRYQISPDRNTTPKATRHCSQGALYEMIEIDVKML